jgi:hypothetical protein
MSLNKQDINNNTPRRFEGNMSVQQSGFTIGSNSSAKDELNTSETIADEINTGSITDNVINTNEINTIVEHSKNETESVSLEAEERWKSREGKEQNFRVKLESLNVGSKGKTYYVKDDADEWEQLKDKRVQYDVPFETLQKMSERTLIEAWKKLTGNELNDRLPGEEEIVHLRNEIVKTLDEEKQKEYRESLIDGEDSGATWILMQKTGQFEKFKLLAVIQCYHQFRKIKEEALLDKHEKIARRAFEGEAGIRSGESAYERQKPGSSNCFCCAGSKIINRLLGDKKDAKVLDQEKVRNFVPRFITKQAYKKLVAGDDYDTRKNDILLFAGYGKESYGNFFADSDVIFDEEKHGGLGRRNVVLRKATFIFGETKNDTIKNNLVEAIKKKIFEVTNAGQMLALRTHNHYVTVTGIKDNKISYLDSLPPKGSSPTEVQTEDIVKFLKGKVNQFDSVELNWASLFDKDAPDSLRKEFSGLDIDKNTGEVIRTNDIKGSEDMAHRAGIVIEKSRDELIAQGNADIARYMTDSICLHRGSFMTDEQFNAWKEKDEAEWKKQLNDDPIIDISRIIINNKEDEINTDSKKNTKSDESEIDTSSEEYTESDLKMQEEAISTRISDTKDAHEKYLEKNKDNGGGLVRPSASYVYSFDKGFNIRADLTQEIREAKGRNTRSRLYTKKENAKKLLEKISEGIKEEKAKRSEKNLKTFYSSMMNDEDYEAMSVLFTGVSKIDKTMVMLMSGHYKDGNNKSIEIAERYKLAARRQALDYMTDHLLALPLSKLDLSDDAHFIEHAAELQIYKEKLTAFKRFYQADDGYPAYIRTNTADGDERYMMLELKLKQLEALAQYYDAKKSLMTDEDYQSHYDEELGIVCEENAPEMQTKVAEKLMKMRRAAIDLSKAFGNRAKGERLIKSYENAETWQDKSRLLAVNAVENCSGTERLVEMARFQIELLRLDTRGHSKAYLQFVDNYQKLFYKLQQVAMNKEKDNLSPDDLIELRRLYTIALKSATDYRAPKSLDNSNRTFVARYTLVDRMIQKLSNDKDMLYSQSVEQSMNLNDALNKAGAKQDAAYSRRVLEDELGNNIERENEDQSKLSDLEKKALVFENRSASRIANYLYGEGTAKDAEVPTVDEFELISERMAERLLAMEKDHLFYKFGNSITAERFDQIWARVEILKKEITEAKNYGKNKRLQIVSKSEFLSFVFTNEDDAWLPPFEERKVVYQNRRKLGRISNNQEFMNRANNAIADFDALISNVFSRPTVELHQGDEAISFGEESFMDMFYIDGKRAVDVLAPRIAQYRQFFNDQDIEKYAFKAELMSAIRENKYQITIAHWNKGADGFYEPVMTDLNLVTTRGGRTVASKTIENARVNRLSRFAAIKALMEKRKFDKRQDATAARWRAEQNQISTNNQDFSNAVDIFMKEREEDRSDEFIAVKRSLDSLYRTKFVLDNNNEESLMLMLSRGEYDWSPENYAKLAELYESLVTYLATHDKAKHAGQLRINSAQTLLLHLKNLMHQKLGAEAKDPVAPTEVPEEKRESILKNVNKMAEYFRKYSSRVGEDTVASADEKLQRRWDMLKSAEEDILFFEQVKAADDLDLDEKYLLEQYHSIREYIKLRKNLKKKDIRIIEKLGNKRSEYIHDKAFEEMGYEDSREGRKKLSSAGLSKEQRAGIREIDHWILRNFKNGGYMSFKQNTVERTDIVDRLMAMSPRERLYIYYVVENKEARKNPKMSDITTSQLQYTPNVAAFKKQIIATPWKFYTRFSGGYVYWNKLTQAMAMCEGSREMLVVIDDHAREKEKEKVNKSFEDSISVSSDQQKEDPYNQIGRKLSALIISNVALNDTLKKAGEMNKKNKKKLSKEDKEKQEQEKEALKNQVEELTARIKTEMNEVMDLNMKVINSVKDFEQKKKSNGIEDIAKTIQIYGTELSTFLTLDFMLHNASTAFCSTNFIDVLDGAAPFATALGAVGNILTMAFYGRAMWKNHASMSDYEKFSNVSGSILKFAETFRVGTHFFKTIGKDGAFIEAIASPTVSAILSPISFMLALGKTGANYENQFTRISGVEIAKANREKSRYKALQSGKKEEQDKYRDGMLRLDELLQRREAVDSGYTMSGASLSLVTTGIVFATEAIGNALSGGIMAVLTGVAFILAGTAKGHLAKFGQRKRREVVGSFFNVDDMVKQAEDDWRREHNGERMSKKQQARLRKQVLYRVSANLGYYSPSQLSHRLAKGYAQYLLNGAKQDGRIGEMCISFIQGIGLPFEMDPDTKVIKKPKASDIESNLCS